MENYIKFGKMMCVHFPSKKCAQDFKVIFVLRLLFYLSLLLDPLVFIKKKKKEEKYIINLFPSSFSPFRGVSTSQVSWFMNN